VFFVRETNETLAQAEMFLANTNTSIGFINFDEQEEAWGVVISGMVSGLRPDSLLVSLSTITSNFLSICMILGFSYSFSTN